MSMTKPRAKREYKDALNEMERIEARIDEISAKDCANWMTKMAILQRYYEEREELQSRIDYLEMWLEDAR